MTVHERELAPYVRLIQDFLGGRIPGSSFEKQYLETIKKDPTRWNEQEHEILEELFEAVDAFCADAELRKDVIGAIDEGQLRHESEVALSKLRQLLGNN